MGRAIRWGYLGISALMLLGTSGCGPGFGGSAENGGGGGGVVTGPVPVIESVSPQPFAGPVAGGTVLTFNGENLRGATVTVANNTCGSVNVNTDGTTVTCVAPAGVPGNATAILRTQRGSAQATFLYQGAPTLTTVFPTPFAGPTAGSTVITLGGTNLQNGAVTLGGTACTSTSVNAAGTSITCVTPARAAGTATVQVVTPGGTATSGTSFLYQAAPTITSTLPTPFAGPVAGNTAVTLIGTNLQNASQVTFGGTACTSLVVNGAGTSITCNTPARPAGASAVVVRTPGGSTTVGSVFTYEGAPTVASVSPRGGPVAGGTTITVTGTNFLSATAVTVGGVACTSVTVTASTSLTCVTPAGSAGSVNVAVTNPTNTGTLAGGFTYEGTPTVTSVSPAFGPIGGGTAVAISGTGLLSLTGITFGGAACTSVTPVSTTTATCTTPARTAGAQDVVVTNSTGSNTLVGGFFYEGTPTVTAVTPSAGGTAGGTTITITGTSFRTATAVRVGGTDCTSFSIQSSTQATCVTPARTAGTVNVQVINPTGTGTLNASFTYESAPTLTLVSPNGGPTAGNTLITLTGTQLRTVSAVTVGGAACSNLTPVSATSATCRTPAGTAGLANVVVTNATGSATLTNGFRYESAPSITAIAPSAGPIGGGTAITITGTMFTTATGVTIGGAACGSFAVASATQVTCVTPPGSAGAADVVVTNLTGTGTSVGGFRYEGAPTISAINPSAGATVGGQTVTITGTNLRTLSDVQIGGVSCTSLNPAANGNSLTCVTGPSGPGVADVVVTNPTGSATLPLAYTYEDVPTVTNVTPSVGATIGGTSITLTGTGFRSTTGVTVGGSPCTGVIIVSGTSLTCNTPPGSAATVDVVLTNASGSGTRTNGFTYVAAPTVASFTPIAGPIAGNTLVTITGTNFQIATGATFNGIACTSFTPVNATTVTCRTPAASAGPATVTVTSGSGSASAPTSFVYEGAPTISGVTPITPVAGTTAGNTLVTVNGTGFLTTTGVTIGGAACTSLTVFSATQITCRTPARPAGAADVVLTNATASATAVGAYTYEAAPTVSNVTPSTGPILGGTTVTLTGTNFLSLTGVTFGGSNCTSITVVSATQATCVTPARPAGAATIVAINASGSGNLPSGFTYEGAPTITSVSPSAGGTVGGTSISITGTNLGTTTSVTVGGSACGSLTVVSATNVTCTTPAGVAGTAAVTVTNGTGIATLGSGFTYESAPTISSISPTFGSAGTTITLTGTRFLTATGISVGGTACSAFTVVSATSATCVVPAGTGVQAVALTNASGTGTLPAAFTYVGTPTVSAITPSAGTTSGGQTVTVTGTNFQTLTALTIGGGNCTSIAVLSATTMTCVTPIGANGAATVTAINSAGTGSLVNGFTYEGTPTLTLVAPASGPPTGGTSITLTGTRFLSTSSVTVGGNPCASVVISSATSITCTTPAGAPGAQAVAVTNATGSASLPAGFVYDNAPTIASVSPVAGTTAGGTTITLTGTGFSSATAATVGGVACTSLTVLSATQVTCVTPARPAGAATVTVTNAAGTGSLTNGYTYEGAPTLTAISPAAGTTAGNTLVTLTGTGFLSASSVTIGGLNCTSLAVASATSLSCRTPANVAGSYNVVVTNGNSTATLANGYTYEGTPTLGTVSPNAGTTAGNTLVTLTGTGFLSVTGVTFGGVACTSLTIVNATSLTCRTPARPAGASTVVVTNPAGNATVAAAYTYEGNPTISTINPNVGSQAGGQTVTITGTSLLSTTSVTIANNPCTSVTVLSATQVTCVTPSGAPGAATVRITNGTNTATLTNGYTYEGAPTLTAVSPAFGPVAGNTLITLTGTSLRSTSGVTVGGGACTSLTVVSATSVTCRTPAATAGVVSIVLTNAFSTATLANSFTYEDTPTISAITPSSGRLTAGPTVTLTGTGFLTVTSVTIGGAACTTFTAVTGTSLTCTKPAGVAGAVDVVVTNPSGSATLVGGFTFEGNPTLTAVSPGSGPIAGGTTITLTGTNFLSAASVNVSGTACTSVTVVSATQVTCVTGARAAGLYNVQIFNGNGNATLNNSFRYEGNPTLTAVAPTSGTTAGGTTITLTGTNLLTATAVTLGGTACTSLTPVSTTSLTCVTPARPAGAATVVVTNPTGSASLTNAFTYEGAPTLTAVSPAAGTTAGNTLITLTGTNFLSTSGVTVGGVACTSLTIVSSTSVTCRTPAAAAGPAVDVVITNATASATQVGGYRYEAAPTVTSVTPNAGSTAGNTLVTITGTGFLSATAVAFSGTACTTITIVSATQITCRTGARTAGAVAASVTNAAGTGTLASPAYTYEGNPTITTITPAAGTTAGGTTVTINGTGFLSATAVAMSGTNCGTLTIVSATQLTCVTGARAAGAVVVSVTNNAGTASSASGAYTYEGAPTVTAVAPAAGTTAGNTLITLTGTNFLSTTGITVGGAACTTIAIASATSLTCRTPAGVAGPAVDIVLTNGNSSVTRPSAYTYEGTPTVTNVSPNAGSILGNTLVTVTGSGFLSATAVALGGTACTSITIVSATQLTCRTGARGAGAVNATVTNPAGTGTMVSPAYTYEGNPTITTITPVAGTTAGGTTVTINGTGFLSVTGVSMSGTACGSITIVSATQITCVTGARGAGAVVVTVTNGNGSVSSASGGYTYEAAPTVTAVAPAAGTTGGNTLITLTGTGFLSATGVTVGGGACTTLTILSNTSATCRTPVGVAGPAVDVVLTNPAGSGTRAGGYTYEGLPTVSLVSPVFGTTAGNTLVTLTGTGFLSVTGVTFGGTACTSLTIASATSLNCRTPVRTAGAVNIVVTNPTGSATVTNGFTYEDAPTFTVISPAAGPAAGGQTVTLTGTRFLSVSSVTFGGTACTSLNIVSATSLTCVTPARPVGQYTVVVTNVSGSATRVNAYTYENAPTLTSIAPNAGRITGGRTVTLTGTNFASATGATFGGVACTTFTVTSATTATCVTPATAAGAVDVIVTNSVGSATLAAGYTFEGTPTVTAVFPTGGPTAGGQTITITGTQFLSTASVNLSGTNCTNVQVVNATTVNCRTGARAAGTVTVSVVNDNGTGNLTNGYVYRAAPTVTSVSPNQGPLAGGTVVTITGTGFLTGAIARFSTVSCTSLTVVSATSITCTTAASASMQRGDVVVTNNDNQSGTLTSGWLYVGTNAWLANTTTGAPLPRRQHSAVWTGSRMLVWGGTDDTLAVTNTGGSYDPVTDSWTAISTGANVPTARTDHQAVWSGTRMVVFGGFDGTNALGDGARYDPVTNTWTTMTATGAPSARQAFTAVWNGTVMVVWGGQAAGTPTNTGGRYNPGTDVWTATTTTGAPAARSTHTAVWSGSQMIVWGGIDGTPVLLNSGSRYDPTGDTWSATGGTPPSARQNHTAVWSSSNSRMVVWGGFDGTTYVNTGSQYDPVGNTWTATTTTGAPAARAFHTAAFTGTRMLIWGGDDTTLVPVNTGGSYLPSGNSWTTITTTGAPSARALHTGVYTGSVMTIFGGRTGAANAVNDGAIYAP